MARKLNKNLLALGSAAVVTVYAVGFARSSSSSPDAGLAATIALPTQSTGQSVPIDAATAVAQAIAAATPAATAASATAAAVTAATYQDGTFTGAGTSRFGGFEVAVSIKGGVITGVELTKVTTRYPASRVAALPGQVVQRQSANVDIISGASNSSRAFKDAVTQALSQAASATHQG
jgi:uncharacterized protein with FMN-binding domain